MACTRMLIRVYPKRVEYTVTCYRAQKDIAHVVEGEPLFKGVLHSSTEEKEYDPEPGADLGTSSIGRHMTLKDF